MSNYLLKILIFLILLIGSSCDRNLDESSFETLAPLPGSDTSIHTMPADHEIFAPTRTHTPSLPGATSTSGRVIDENVDSTETVVVNLDLDVAYVLCSPLVSEEISQLREIISDPYNPPASNREERHHGIDFSYYRRNGRAGIEGERIHSILPGIVAAKVIDRLPYGNMVIIETSADQLPQILREKLNIDNTKSLYTLYAHMKDEPDVELGEKVNCGQAIGRVGLTGYNVVNPHLHLETRIGVSGTTFGSMVFYDTSALPIEMENYRRWRTSGDFIHFDPMLLFQFYIESEY